MADPKNKKPQPTGNYAIGYKKPPAEHQFKPSYLRDGAQKARRQGKSARCRGRIEKSVQVKRGGKTITMHPFEAEVTSLANRALKGEPRATKLFLQHCETAGLLKPPVAEQTHGVFVIPRGVNRGIVRVLLETCGLRPWDSEIYAALEAEYERDQARIEELYTFNS